MLLEFLTTSDLNSVSRAAEVATTSLVGVDDIFRSDFAVEFFRREKMQPTPTTVADNPAAIRKYKAAVGSLVFEAIDEPSAVKKE